MHKFPAENLFWCQLFDSNWLSISFERRYTRARRKLGANRFTGPNVNGIESILVGCKLASIAAGAPRN